MSLTVLLPIPNHFANSSCVGFGLESAVFQSKFCVRPFSGPHFVGLQDLKSMYPMHKATQFVVGSWITELVSTECKVVRIQRSGWITKDSGLHRGRIRGF